MPEAGAWLAACCGICAWNLVRVLLRLGAGAEGRRMDPRLELRFVVPAEAGTQFDLRNIQMNSRFRGNDDLIVAPAQAGAQVAI